MTHNKEITELLQKFALNQCNAEEIEKLVVYFRKASSSVDFPEVEDLLAKLESFEELDTESSNQIFEEILAKRKRNDINSKAHNLNRKSFLKYASAAAVIIGIIAISYFFNSPYNFGDEKNINETSDTFQHRANTSEEVILHYHNGDMEIISEDGTSEVVDNQGNHVGRQNGNQLIYHGKVSSHELIYNTLTVPYGRKFELVLSDGTRTYLNAGTTIKYPVKFLDGQERKVFVQGEAYFEVARDVEHPFIINTDHLDIRVLGTKFNVSNYPEDLMTDVVLVEGSVNLQEATEELNTESLLLEPGHKGSFDKKERKLASKEVSTSIYTSWIDGELVFIDLSFESILKKLERSYNVTIENQNKDIAQERFNARFRKASLETVLDYFKTTYGLDYKFQGNSIIIY
ncbi:hypothetical protein KCTC52924_03652 [Arenibacter antarcticus]|uniref:FecR family protein n=1 Tax=Arenibacter antarcticus TaxID=2040469 RepID=A0ABW5VDZ6_9FLAO|nr:FecR domain-containing protein [Arenibacter sp. H213]MCM4168099.1 iron dicitrate transport regulator FecR [Arenibacter sp. H213]